METTALEQGEFVQVAVIDRSGATLVDTLVRPSGAISAEALAIHQITEHMVAGAPTFPDVYPRLAQALRERTVVVFSRVES